MKTILYMAMSMDGFIAKANDDTSFVSDAEWRSFRAMVQRTKNLIVGARTYAIMKKGNEFEGLEDIRVLVVAADSSSELLNEKHSFAPSPKEALAALEKEGFQEALVAGGGTLNGSFMQEGLLDELFLDIEPIALGAGIQLFGGKELDAKLKLLGTKKLSEDEIQLHYQVEK